MFVIVLVVSLLLLLLLVLMVVLRSVALAADELIANALEVAAVLAGMLLLLVIVAQLHQSVEAIVTGPDGILGAVVFGVLIAIVLGLFIEFGAVIVSVLILAGSLVFALLSSAAETLADWCDRGFAGLVAGLERQLERKGGKR